MAELGEVKRKIAEFETKGNIDKAITELEKAVKEFPKEGSLFNKLGDLYIKVKKQKNALDTYEKGARVFKEETYFPNAIALCKKILRFDKDRTEIYGILGELHKELDQRGEAANYLLEFAERKIESNDLEVALNSYNTIKELVPNNPKILQTISAIYEQMGKKDEARELLEEAKQIESEQGKLKETLTTTVPTQITKKEPTVIKEKAEETEKKAEETEEKAEETEKKAEGTEERAEEIVTEEPKKKIPLEEIVSPEVAELLKDEHRKQPAEEGGVKQEEAIELSEIDRTVELGELYLSLGSEDEAIDCFINAANEAWNQKDYDKALILNGKIADLRPFDLKSRQHLIEIAEVKGDNKLQVKSMLELAEALNRREARSEARSIYKKILEVDPKNEVAVQMLTASEQPTDFIDLGAVLRTELEEEKKVSGIQSIGELISEFRREVFESIGEGDHRSHYDLGVAYKGMGLSKEAIEEFEIAAKDENIKLKALEMIGTCLLDHGKIEDALKILNEGLNTSDRPAQEYFGLHFLIGKCYEQQNHLTKALKSYVDAYNIDKTVPDLIKKINILKEKLTERMKKKGKKIRQKKAEARESQSSEVDKTVPKKSKITYL